MYLSQALVAYIYNPSYSGGRDKDYCGLKPTWSKQFKRPYLEKNPTI
jgi:hypothetical protein